MRRALVPVHLPGVRLRLPLRADHPADHLFLQRDRLVTVWGGFSTKWYGALCDNEQMLDAAWLSLQIAAIAATVAVMLGTIAGLVLARFGRFRGRTLFSGMITAPLVMPEVITGLSLLLLFVAMEQLFGWPAGRGIADDHHRPHHLRHGLRRGRRAVAAGRASTNRSRRRRWISAPGR